MSRKKCALLLLPLKLFQIPLILNQNTYKCLDIRACIVLTCHNHHIKGISPLRYFGKSGKLDLYHFRLCLERGMKVAMVKDHHTKPDNDHVAIAQPNHSIPSPRQFGFTTSLNRQHSETKYFPPFSLSNTFLSLLISYLALLHLRYAR